MTTPNTPAPRPLFPLPTLTEWHIGAEPIMKYFRFDHLKDEMLQRTSAAFCDLAMRVVEQLPRNPERTVALRKLLEAKDAAVRALLP